MAENVTWSGIAVACVTVLSGLFTLSKGSRPEEGRWALQLVKGMVNWSWVQVYDNADKLFHHLTNLNYSLVVM